MRASRRTATREFVPAAILLRRPREERGLLRMSSEGSIIPLRSGHDGSAGSAAEPQSSGPERAAPGTRPERYGRKAGRLVHRLLGLGDTAGAIFFSEQRSPQLLVVGDPQAGLSGKAQRGVGGAMVRPVAQL